MIKKYNIFFYWYAQKFKIYVLPDEMEKQFNDDSNTADKHKVVKTNNNNAKLKNIIQNLKILKGSLNII